MCREWLRAGERLDDLQRCGYWIIQNPGKACFGMDAVLLSDFTRVRPGENVLDLGTGTGILPILLAAKTQGGHFTGLEIQTEMAEMADRSVRLNGLEEKIGIVEGDLRTASEIFGQNVFDVVVSNPPYLKEGRENEERSRALSRHEILCTLGDVIRETSRVLKPGGKFFLVHRPERLPEILEALQRNRLEPKRMRLVHSCSGKEASLVLLESVRGGHPGLKVEAPLIVCERPGIRSRELRKIYGEEEN